VPSRGFVYGDAGAENGRNSLERNGLGYSGDVGCLCNAILLEGAVDRVA